MNKGPSSSSVAAKTPTSLPSAWAKGPPKPASSSSTRPQSPAPAVSQSQSQSQSHSRRSSQLGGNAVGVGIASGSRGVPPSKPTNPINFGTVNGSSDKPSVPSSSPAPSPPPTKSESRPVQSFGSIEATQTSMPTTAKPSLTSNASNPSSSSASAAASTRSSTPATTHKTKVDVSSFFRGGGSDTKSSSPVNASFPETVTSPPLRSSTLSPAVPPPQSQNTPGQAGLGPHPHVQPYPHQQPPQQYPPPFVPAGMRNPVGGGPRSPNYQRAMPNGAPGRPPVNSGPPGPNGNNMPSPRLAPPQPHVQHQHQHQGQPTPVQGMPPMQAMPGWPGYYYPYVPGMPMQGVPGTEHYMHYPPQPWQMHPQQHPHQGPPGGSGPPQTPLSHTHGLPVSSPRQPPAPLQAPGTPPTGISAPLPSAGPRLNTNASAFVPSHAAQSSQRRVKITDASGHEVDLDKLRKHGATPSSTSSTPASDKNGRQKVRLETEEARLKRIEEEERRTKVKEEDERKKREAKEAEERKQREAEEKAKAEEDARLKAEEKRKRKEEEESRRKEEEEKERIRLEEERRQKEEESERLRREEEEMERTRKEEEERRRREEEERRQKEEEAEHRRIEEERRRKEEEEERQRKEDEERRQREAEERRRKEEEEARAKTEAEAEVEKAKSVPLEIKSKTEGESATVTDTTLSASPETSKRRPIPGPLDLSSTHKSVAQPLPSALATARHIQDVNQVQYPEGIKSPKPELNANAKDGKFRYDRDFLLQFMSVCKEKPDNLPNLEAIGLEPVDQSHSIGRGGSGRRGVPGGMGPPSSTAARQASIGLGLGTLNGKAGSPFAMGNFSAGPKLTSEERFIRSSSLSGGPNALPFGGGRASPMVRTASQGGPGASGNKRTRSGRGNSSRNDSNRISAAVSQFNANATTPIEPVAPLEHSANRWVAGSTSRRGANVDQDSPEIVDKKVRALLNKLTMEKFESISNQIIAWANRSENEKDGRTLIQVIRLVFEKATDEAAWSEMYARLCRKMMEQISPNVQDDGIRNAEGKPITGGLLFRKYLLNRCQEDFERGWSAKETTAAAAKVKATEDQAVKDANEKNKESGTGEEVSLYSEEYYAAQKAKRQGLGLIKFIGELFKLQMLTERIMHECIKKLLSNVDNPEEEEIESLCKLLSTVGQALDTSKARGHMDVYFTRMKELAKSSNVSSRMQFMLQDVIELRERRWIPRNAAAAPQTIAQIHESAAKEKLQQEQHNLARQAMSRGGSRRGQDRDGPQIGPDGWAVASGPSRPANKAGDLTNFGKIQKGGGTMSFGPNSVFTKKGDSKRDSASLSRASSNTNMFQMLQAAESGNEPPVAPSSRGSRAASRTTSVDLTHNPPIESTPSQRPKLNLLPRSKPLQGKSEPSPGEGRADEEGEEGEIVEKDAGKPSMSKEQAEKKIDQDRKEFFAIRDLDEGEEYFSALPPEHRHILIEKLVLHALEAKEADAKLVASLFERVNSKNICSPATFEDGFTPAAEALDDIAIDAPKAPNLFAIMIKGAKLDEERRTRIASKSMDSDRLLALLA